MERPVDLEKKNSFAPERSQGGFDLSYGGGFCDASQNFGQNFLGDYPKEPVLGGLPS
jgi:hypothetical protein